MKTITLELTERDILILRKHLSEDISFGSEGTFGNGVKITSNGEFNRAKFILRKLEEVLGWFSS